MKILITGGAGFIGSHIADTFIQDGHDVTIIDNLFTGHIENINSRAGFFKLDIRSDQVEEIFKENQFDVVCHQAAQMDVRKSVDDPLFDADVNIKGTLNLLQNCVKYKVKKFLFASTGGAVYGEQDVFPCDEEHPTRPVSPYGITKMAIEKYLYFYQIEYDLKHVILRYANVYGPRQNPHGEAGVVAIFTEKLLLGKQPVINGDGKQTRDYVYVGDVVAANRKALTCNKNEIFNIGTGIETDVNTIFSTLNDIVGSKATEKHGPSKGGEQQRSVIDSQKAKTILHWQLQTDISKGLKKTVGYFTPIYSQRYTL